MIVVLNKNLIKPLKSVNFSGLKKQPIIKENESKVIFEFDTSDLLDIKLLISEEISINGVDENGAGNINEYGKQLYTIYDSILAQTKH